MFGVLLLVAALIGGPLATRTGARSARALPHCSIGSFAADPVTGTLVFESSCDPFGTNPFGQALFAMRPDGTGLRQLTTLRGMTTDPDGTVHVEMPGPFAYSARLR